MEQKFVTILDKIYPVTLDLLKGYNHRYMDIYTIQPVFSLFNLEREIHNALAMLKGSDRFILSTDSNLIEKIKRKLWNINTRVHSSFCYVHKTEPVCYFNSNFENSLAEEETKVCQLLTETELQILLNPFIWKSESEKEKIVETKFKEEYGG